MIDLVTLQRALVGISKIDVAGALAAVQAGDIQGDLLAAEQVADFVADFWPDAKYVEDVLKLAGFVIQLKQDGVIPPQPADAVVGDFFQQIEDAIATGGRSQGPPL